MDRMIVIKHEQSVSTVPDRLRCVQAMYWRGLPRVLQLIGDFSRTGGQVAQSGMGWTSRLGSL